MALFDDIGRKITQTGQGAVKKVRDATEVSRLKALMTDEEKIINNAYTQIGKKYYELHQAEGAEPEEAYAVWVSYISAAMKKIENYKEEIRNIQSVVKCPGCGAECSYAVPFCGHCGTSLAEARAAMENVPHCPNCGAEVSASALFCTGCGSRLTAEE